MVNSSATVDLHTCDSHSDTIEGAWESAVLLMLCVMPLKKFFIKFLLRLLLSYYFVQEIITVI